MRLPDHDPTFAIALFNLNLKAWSLSPKLLSLLTPALPVLTPPSAFIPAGELLAVPVITVVGIVSASGGAIGIVPALFTE